MSEMTSITYDQNPFYRALDKALREVQGINTISLTDRHGDQIAVAHSVKSAHPTSPEELGLIQVYGQLTFQRSKVTPTEMSASRGHRHWFSRRLDVDGDRYDLWVIWSTLDGKLSEAEVSLAVRWLETSLRPLLRG